MYEFIDFNGNPEEHPTLLIPEKDFNDIKFGTIEFLFYFLKEDYDLVRLAEKAKNKNQKKPKKKKGKSGVKVEFLG